MYDLRHNSNWLDTMDGNILTFNLAFKFCLLFVSNTGNIRNFKRTHVLIIKGKPHAKKKAPNSSSDSKQDHYLALRAITSSVSRIGVHHSRVTLMSAKHHSRINSFQAPMLNKPYAKYLRNG